MAVTVLETGPADRLVGAIGYAPELVVLLNEVNVATELARRSIDSYEHCSVGGVAGLDRVGGLEVALSDTGLDALRRRSTLGGDAGLRAEVLGPDELATLAPELINMGGCVGGVHYPEDGTAPAGQPHDGLCDRALRLYRDIYATA